MKTTGLDAIAAENKVYYCMAYTVLGSSELIIAAETTSLHMLRTSILVPSSFSIYNLSPTLFLFFLHLIFIFKICLLSVPISPKTSDVFIFSLC